MTTHAALCLPLVSVAAACGAGGEATVTVTVYGEDFIEQGIPAETFVDDWTVTFDRFLVSVGDVALGDHGEPDVYLDDGPYRVIDLAADTGGAGTPVSDFAVGPGTYDHIGFRIAPPGAGAEPLNVSPDDVEAMIDGGYAVYVEGRASRGGEEKTFAWGFSTATRYAHCHGTPNDLVDGEAAAIEATVHGDHLFYDDLVSSEPNVAFDLIAVADDAGDADGDVTSAELAATDITTEARYQVGNADAADLWSFIDHQVSTLGHVDGEGHCAETVRE